MFARHREWIAALGVLVLITGAVVLDLADGAVRRFWDEHSFTSSVVGGLLVLLLTVLVVDRVNRMRQLKGQSQVVAVQAAVIVAQIRRAADGVRRSAGSEELREQASEELRNAVQMLFTSSPVLIDGKASRAFLETAQRTVAVLFRSVRVLAGGESAGAEAEIDTALVRLQEAAAPLIATLNRQQRDAVSARDTAPTDGP